MHLLTQKTSCSNTRAQNLFLAPGAIEPRYVPARQHFPEQGLGLSAHACLAARRVVVTLTAAQAWCQFCNKQQNLNAFCSYLAVHFQKLSAEDRQASAARRSDGRRKKAKV